jgi:hypothetical protein
MIGNVCCVIEGRRGAGRCNWEVLELELSDAEQKNSVWGFLVQYIAGVSLKLLWSPKTSCSAPVGDAPIVGVR